MKNTYVIKAGVLMKELTTLHNKQQAYDTYKALSRDNPILYLYLNGKLLVQQSKPHVVQQKLGKEAIVKSNLKVKQDKMLNSVFANVLCAEGLA